MRTMSTAHHATDSDQSPEGRGLVGRITRLPMVWMLAGIAGIGLIQGLTTTRPGLLPLIGAATAVAAYWAIMRFVARRRTPEIARRSAGRETLLGGALGLGFVLVSTLVITMFGGYSFSWAGRDVLPVALSAATVMACVAVAEELMFRGIALQALEQLWSGRVALVLTALFFGGAHLFNPGASMWSALAITAEAGVLLGAAFLWRRSIWFVTGLHFAWNTTQQLLGIPVSGRAANGLLTADVTGPDLLTGGTFGLDASIVSVVIGLLLAAPMLVLAHRRGALTSPRRAHT
ncbi:CPBP family intramembrane metalloprotease [Micromonospora sp. WMMA1363]|uniref:CPBP family intramembrane glutamic endopeptidase n=1 Tax=Micromonospora sp. WMMA1363 TaxID=3053985 RepID=UPI00259D117D|nr:CPBP family intramembrane glutamic endopeptidase [Micromonospora sp. WMMA1363]MDM4719566.1 CPBP family intramembrane metalloprotease [Micromonospora sp. WMMA1363]